MKPSDRLSELEIALPVPAAPIGSYIPAVRSGRLIFTSGQLPLRDGKLLFTGKVPSDVTLEKAAEASGIAILNALGAAAQLAGRIDDIDRVIRVCVFVNSSPGFFEQPTVANGASDLLVKIFGDKGRHARSAVGVTELPKNAAVEVELVVETQ